MATTIQSFLDVANYLLKDEFAEFVVTCHIKVTRAFNYETQSGNYLEMDVPCYIWNDDVSQQPRQDGDDFNKSTLKAIMLVSAVYPNDTQIGSGNLTYEMVSGNSTLFNSLTNKLYKITNVQIDSAQATIMLTLEA